MTHWKAGLALALTPWSGAHAQQIFGHGFEESCLIDTDQDRLVDCEEAARFTSITLPDTDGDVSRTVTKFSAPSGV